MCLIGLFEQGKVIWKRPEKLFCGLIASQTAWKRSKVILACADETEIFFKSFFLFDFAGI